MTLHRRSFLSQVAAGFAVGAVLPFRPARAGGDGAPVGAEALDWAAIRRDFNLDPGLIHLASFFLASHPRPVRDAIERWRALIDANPLLLEEALFEPGHEHLPEVVKRALAEYLGGRPEEVALTPNTTTGLALVYHGLPLAAGHEILLTDHDHFVHHESARLAAQRAGANVRFVALHDGAAGATEAEMIARLRKAIGARTRAVGLTWVHSSTGLKLPIRKLAQVVQEANRGRADAERCLLVVDGVHGFGVVDEDAAALGADFFVAGTHKWLFGPRGTGLIWAKAEAWRRIRPTVPSFDSLGVYEAWIARRQPPPTDAAAVAPGGFVAFEHQFGLEAAVRYHQRIGRARIAARLTELNGKLRRELARMPHVTLHTPLDDGLAAGIVCFEVKGLSPGAVVKRLRERRIIATTSPYAVSYARLAAGIMVSSEEVDTALGAVRSLDAS